MPAAQVVFVAKKGAGTESVPASILIDYIVSRTKIKIRLDTVRLQNLFPTFVPHDESTAHEK